MGEQEQSGMLRIVVVLGLIALIAGASIASIVTLKGQMASHTQNVVTQVDNAQPMDFDAYWQKFKNLGYSSDNQNWIRMYADTDQTPGKAVLYKGGNNWVASAVHSDNGIFRATDVNHNLNGHAYGQGWDSKNDHFYQQIYDYATGQKAPSNVYYDDASNSYKIK